MGDILNVSGLCAEGEKCSGNKEEKKIKENLVSLFIMQVGEESLLMFLIFLLNTDIISVSKFWQRCVS